MQTKISREHIGVFLLLLMAIVLRFYNLDGESLWNDELSTWKRSSAESVGKVIHLSGKTDVHPPGYQVFMYLWISVFGDSEFSLRFPSALAGLISIGLIFVIGHRWFGFWAGIFAASILGVSDFAIFYSQEARSYSLLLMCVLWIVVIGENLQTKESTFGKVGFLMVLIFTAYLHYFGMYFVGIYVLYRISTAEKRKIWLQYSAMVGFSILLWVPKMMEQISRGAIYIAEYQLIDILRWAKQMFFDSWILSVFMVVVGIWLAFRHELTREKKKKIVVLIAWILVVWIPLWIVSTLGIPILTFPNMIISLPALYLLFGAIVNEIKVSERINFGFLAVILVFGMNKLVFEKQYYSQPKKQQFREAVGFVLEENRKEGLPVYGYVWDVDYLRYYSDEDNSSNFREFSMEQVLSQDQKGSFWVLEAHRVLPDSLTSFLQKEYHISVDSSFLGARVRKLQRKE